MDALHLLLIFIIFFIVFIWILRFIGNYYGLSAHRAEEGSLIVKKWEKDVVYLVKYADNNYCINASPFCLKLEFFLRYHKIVYKPIEAKFLSLSSEGKKPFIEYNGRHYPDSDVIINFLVKEKKIKYNMTSEQKAVSHLVQRLCDKSIYILNLYSKLEENMPMFAKIIKGNAATPDWHLLFMKPIMYYFLWNRVNSDGTGGHTKEEVVELLQQDLDAAERILGEKKFVAGEEASGGDFALFAHLMCAYYLPFTIPLRKIVDSRCPRLKAYMDRNHWNFFADYLLHDNEKVV